MNNEMGDIFLYNYSHLDYFLRITNENEITQSIEYILLGLDINQERQEESHSLERSTASRFSLIVNGKMRCGVGCSAG